MNKLLLIGLLGLSNCASFVADFERGWEEQNAANARAINYTNNLVVGMAAIDRYDRATQAQRTEEIKMIPRANTVVQPVCYPVVNAFGEVVGCR